jgi:protein-L-isoaspartate(D-aspartate) O-methyltransferase
MLSPALEAKMLQALQLRKSDKVLEIGTGSGYMAALLGARSDHVYTVEIEPELAATARASLERHCADNVTVIEGDGAQGWPSLAPYDAIVLSGSVAEISDALLAQLKVGGRLLAVVGEAPLMQARLVTCVAEGRYQSVNLFETSIPRLRNVPERGNFVF